MVRKNKDRSDKEPGQQLEEITEAQRILGHNAIGNIQGSKNRDKTELINLADEALEQYRQKKTQQASQVPAEED